MKTPAWLRSSAAKYTLYGALFGAAFPIVALIIVVLTGREFDLLFYIICTAPFFLGLFSRFAGVRQDSLNDINRSLEARVAERTAAIQNLLDVSGQGFLYFGSDYLVRPEHSRECVEIFQGDIVGRRVSDLLFLNEAKRAEFTEGLDLFFQGKAGSDVIFDLLDTETSVDDKIIEMQYRAINESSIMCTLTDVTERKRLEAEVTEQNRRRNIILRTISNRKYFSSFVSEARELIDFCDKGEGTGPVYLEELMRRLHTFKSNAAFVGFESSQKWAHEMEGEIADAMVLETPVNLSKQTAGLKERYYDELSVITGTLGEEWVASLESTVIPLSHYRKIERYVRTKYGKDDQLARTLEGYRKIRIADVFARYPVLARELAQTRGKRLNPIVITGGEEKVLPERFDEVADSCVHLLRNMIDHGIESPHERELKGKSPDGTITIDISASATEYLITFSDDGNGLPLERIARKARETGLLKGDEKLSKQKLLALIFHPGFSTNDEVSSVSGRGVGLSALREEVRKAGGRIMVDSKPEIGTTFRIALPK